jgi:hypothetical protein
MNPFCAEPGGPANVVVIIRVSTIYQNVARVDYRGKFRQNGLNGSGRNHQPNSARLVEHLNQFRE